MVLVLVAPGAEAVHCRFGDDGVEVDIPGTGSPGRQLLYGVRQADNVAAGMAVREVTIIKTAAHAQSMPSNIKRRQRAQIEVDLCGCYGLALGFWNRKTIVCQRFAHLPFGKLKAFTREAWQKHALAQSMRQPDGRCRGGLRGSGNIKSHGGGAAKLG